jgi:cytochrome c-type biogenesis protein CcmH
MSAQADPMTDTTVPVRDHAPAHDRAALDRRWRPLALLAFVLAGVVVIVAQTGDGAPMQASPAKPSPAPAPQPGATAAPHALGSEQIAALIERLSQRLAQQPDDADGWAMLARSLVLTGQQARALPAFRKATALRPDDPVLLADFADALATTQQGRLGGEPIELVQRALAVDGRNLKALSLAGTEAFARRDWAAALRHWQALQVAGGTDNALVQQVQGGIDAARALAATLPTPAPKPVKVKISR